VADTVKIDDAEKAYAAAAAEVKPAKAQPKPEAAAKPEAPVKAEETAKAPAVAVKAKPAKAAPKIEKKKPAPRRVAAQVLSVPARIKAKIANKAAAPQVAVNAQPVVTELKETIMSKTTTDFAKPIADAFGEFQARATDAYSKSTAALTEATEFAKGNVEALVESTKIFAAGVQDLSKGYVEEAKSAYETVTGDVKELAAVKSPTELFQLQGKIARRNFDALVATSSKNTDALVKLANDAFAPLSGRVNLAAEKLAKVA